MKAIFIDRTLTKKEIKNVNKLLMTGDFHLFLGHVSKPEQINYTLNSSLLTANKIKRINYNVIKKVLSFGNKKINGISIKDWLIFENTSLFYYHKSRLYFSLRNYFYLLEEVRLLGIKYSTVNVYTTKEFSGTYKNYNFKNVCFHHKRNKIKYIKILFFCQNLFIVLYRIFTLIGQKTPISNKNVIIDRVSNRIYMLERSGRRTKFQNAYLGYLIDKVDSSFMIINEMEIPKLSTPPRIEIVTHIKEPSNYKNDHINSEYILIRSIFSFKVMFNVVTLANQLKNTIDLLIDSEHDFFDKWILQKLLYWHSSTCVYLFKYFSYKAFFHKYKVKTVTTIDENSPQMRSIIDSAKSLGIHTIGIQHGGIHELHPAYLYTSADWDLPPVPSITLVWGQYWKSLLINKGSYPAEKIVVIGQLRTDVIPKLQSNVLNGLQANFNNSNHIVLYASQPQRDKKIRKKSTEDVFKAIKYFKNVELLIKPHPREYDDNYFHSIASEIGCNNYHIIRDVDLYLLIYKCTIVITCFSTVGSEAVYFYKPLIILDHLKQDILGYKRSGVAFQAVNDHELIQIIERLINKDLFINKKNYSNFINNYAYKIDGNVVNRYLQKIKTIC